MGVAFQIYDQSDQLLRGDARRTFNASRKEIAAW